nr:copia protein [Tanacetum cinerariifolium]
MVLYNALPKNEHERIFMCKTAKDIWQSLLITHQGNSQVKDNKIDLLDSGFARCNTIITSLKALDECFSSKNYVRMFLRALHPKWRAKVMEIKESKVFTSLALDELVRNLKVHEVVMEKDFEIYRGKKERIKSLALKAKKESSDDETLTSESDDEEYAMVVRNFKNFLEERVSLLGNQEKKRSHSDKGIRRKVRVTGNVLDAVIQIISLVIFQNHLATKIKSSLLEVLGAIGKITPKTKLMMKLVSWLNRQMRSLNVTFDESPLPTKLSSLVDDDVGEKEAIKKNTKVVNNNKEDELIEVDEIVNIKESKNHPIDQVIGNLNQRTLSPFTYESIDHRNKMGFGNKLDENGIVSRNKARFVAQGYNQQEGIYYDETCAPVDRLELIRILLAIACANDLKLYQMDVKNDFLNDFINNEYIKEMLKKFGLEDSKPTKTPMSKEIKLTKNDEADSMDSSKYQDMIGTRIETIVYADSDHAGDYVDRKSTSGICMFMGCCLTSWFTKKKTTLAISMTEAEYIFVGKACQHGLWMKQALIDYGICLDDIIIMCNNKGAIDLSKNPIQHFKTKHIEIHHHFLRDNVQKENISIKKVASEDNIADIFTKTLKHEAFNYLRLGLRMMELIMDSNSPSLKNNHRRKFNEVTVGAQGQARSLETVGARALERSLRKSEEGGATDVNVVKSSPNIIERSITELVEFINTHLSLSLELIYKRLSEIEQLRFVFEVECRSNKNFLSQIRNFKPIQDKCKESNEVSLSFSNEVGGVKGRLGFLNQSTLCHLAPLHKQTYRKTYVEIGKHLW